MSDTPKGYRTKEIWRLLEPGEIERKGDMFRGSEHVWKDIPEDMIGHKIPAENVRRRETVLVPIPADEAALEEALETATRITKLKLCDFEVELVRHGWAAAIRYLEAK